MGLALLSLLLGVAPAARASIFSPGPLAKPHAPLEGLKNCTQCHEAGQRLSQQKCLDCHQELDTRVGKGEGFHGRMPAAERACETCHADHQGEAFQLIDWGPGGKDGFDHQKTGWALKGGHTRVACAKCHDPRLIVDARVRKLLAEHPRKQTFLGAPETCKGCHFDEHRGQVATTCESCHDEKQWKPAPKFDHGETDFPLRGKHVDVACGECHERKPDTGTPADAFPAPVARDFLQLEGIPHAQCQDCHEDPHQGRFGSNCTSCHTEQDWRVLKGGAKDRAFHEKTRYPLRGAHVSVDCKACHGPFPGRPAKFRGLPFGACTDCHADAHLGQMSPPVGATSARLDCQPCHTVEGFTPARFELQDHAKTSYPLEGSHQVAACRGCHAEVPALARRVPAAVHAALQRMRRPERFSWLDFDVRKAKEGCEGCHRDPHGGQFQDRAGGCASCHAVTSFLEVTFDHARDSRFALEGKHAQAACASCHVKRGSEPVRYRPLDTACAACHDDVHAGQFAKAGVPADCARCHDASAFEPCAFRHEPPFTTFLLDGKHAAVACEGCHPKVTVSDGRTVVRYKPTPRECQSCHADFHKGAFRGFEP